MSKKSMVRYGPLVGMLALSAANGVSMAANGMTGLVGVTWAVCAVGLTAAVANVIVRGRNA